MIGQKPFGAVGRSWRPPYFMLTFALVNNRDFRPKFCPSCGGSLTRRRLKAGEPPRLVCQACRFVYYLDPKLAACAIIEIDGRLLLNKRAISPGQGLWVIPGGFVDRGETVPQAVCREVSEECGLTIEVGPLIGLYSYPGETVVVAVHSAEVVGGWPKAIDESLAVGLFGFEEIPWDRLAFQSTRDCLRDYFRRKTDAQAD